eukprot:gene41221-6535_t
MTWTGRRCGGTAAPAAVAAPRCPRIVRGAEQRATAAGEERTRVKRKSGAAHACSASATLVPPLNDTRGKRERAQGAGHPPATRRHGRATEDSPLTQG